MDYCGRDPISVIFRKNFKNVLSIFRHLGSAVYHIPPNSTITFEVHIFEDWDVSSVPENSINFSTV